MTARRGVKLAGIEAQRDQVLAQYASDVVLILDARAKVQYLSPSAERLMGYREEDWLGLDALQVIHPDDLELAAGAFGRALAVPGVNQPLEMRVRKVGDGWRWFEVVATNLIDHPAIRGVVLCARDITPRVEAHEALQRSEDRLSALLRHSNDIVCVLDPDGAVSYISPSAARRLGYDGEIRVGTNVFDFVHPDDLQRVREVLASIPGLDPGQRISVELRVAHGDGSWHDFEVVVSDGSDDPAVAGIVCNARDVTDLRNARAQVSVYERRFEAMLANLSDLISVIDANGNMSYLSPATRRLLGRNADDRLGASILDFVHPDDLEATTQRLHDALLVPGLIAPFETRVLHEDGTYRIFEVRANNLLHDPAVNGIIVNSRDITDRVNAEAALRANERLYRTIVETANEGIWMSDANNVTTFVNRRMAEMLGVQPGDMIGRNPFDFVNDDGLRLANDNLEHRRRGESGQFDFEFVRDDGTSFWAMVSASPLIDENGTYHGSIGLITDLTERMWAEAELRAAVVEREHNRAELERHRLEAELDQARRLESLGRLAAGIAHDFNNLMGVILNYASVAAKQLTENEPAAQDLARIQRAAEQAADVTRKLLVFGHADPVHPEVFDLNELVADLAELIGGSFGDEVGVVAQLAAERCPVEADRSQIEQLVTNLLLNARDALPSGGTITVTTACETDAAAAREGETRDHVVLTIADNGVGMEPEVPKRAFEPFFTTKPAERGSGLGLATVHTIAARARGHVSIKSVPMAGTTVRVRLPKAPA
ncbi:MAG TPA: PAS domain S-box protein [Acidimicrobiia bacterium]|nr:PAS domain S-box protein [Acidimicrobiia bacterium]